MGTQTTKLLLEVDASITVAQRAVRSLRESIAGDVKGIEAAMAKADVVHRGLTGTLGNTRIALLEVQHVARASADQFAAGAPAIQILTAHMAQLGEAAGLAGGSMGRLGTFLGGGWGIALTFAATVLAKLAVGTEDAVKGVDELLQKMRESAAQAANNKIADEQWRHTIEGLTDAIRKRREEQEKSLKTDIQQEQADLASARRDADELERKRNDLQAKVNVLRGEIKDLRSRPVNPDDAIGASDNLGQLSFKQKRLNDLEAQLRIANAAVPAAQARIRGSEIPLDERAVANSFDKSKAAADAYTVALGRLNDARQKGDITRKQYRDQLSEAQKTRDAAQAADREAKKGGSGFAKVTGREVASLLGTTPNGGGDGSRSAAHNAAVGGARNSYHLTGQAIDIPLTVNGKPLTKEGIRSTLEAAGVQIKELLGPGDKGHSDHFHVAFAKQRAGPDQIAAAEGRRAKVGERAADKTLHVDISGKAEQARAEDELRAAQAALVTDIKERARLAEEDVKRDLERQKDAIAAQVSEHQITRAAAEKQILTKEETAKVKLAGIAAQRTLDLDRQSVDLTNSKLQTDAEHLRALDELAVSTREHRDIQRRIVDDLSAVEINAAKEALSSAERSKNSGLIALAQLQLEAAYQHRADALVQNDRVNASPIQAYANSLPKTLGEVNDRLEEIAVRGLKGLEDDLVRSTTKALGLKGALGDIVSELLHLALQMAQAGSGGHGGILGAITGIASLFGGGGGGGGFSLGGGGGGSTLDFSGLPGLAAGGPMIGGKPYLVGERGPEIVVPRASGVVIPNHKAFGGGSSVVVNINAQDAVLSQTVRGWIMEGMTMAADAGGDVAIARSGRMNRRIMP